VCQIQRFDFDCNLVVAQKLIIRVPPGLGLNPLINYIKAFQPLVELAIKKSSTSAEKLLCIVKSYEYRYRAQDKPSQMHRQNRSTFTILEGPRRME
jgi:hypothetical protein